MIITEESIRSQDQIFIFGYGSLVWKPDFEHSRSFVAYLSGHERRFWQGSPHHRGTVEKPGRAFTLKQSPGAKVWGVVYEVNGRDKVKKACDYLYVREQSIGCYDMKMLPVYSKDARNNSQPINAVVYYATPQNKNYTGDEGVEKIAKVIASSHGVSGHNIEYLFRLTDFMQECLPNEPEQHLYAVDRLVRTKIGLSHSTIHPWKLLIKCDRFRKIISGVKIPRRHSDIEENKKIAIAIAS